MEMNEYTEQFLFSGRDIRRKRQSGATYRKQEHRRLDIPKYSGEERTLRIEYRLSKIEGIMFFRQVYRNKGLLTLGFVLM